MTHTEKRARRSLIGGMAFAGMSDQDIASSLGLKLSSVRIYRAQQGIKLARGRKACEKCQKPANQPTPPKPQDARIADMSDMYTHGNTLQQIGEKYGISRERVRQLLARIGICSDQGGAHIRAFLNQKRTPKHSKWESRCVASMGCSRAAYKELTGNEYRTADVHAQRFIRQRQNAKNRGISFELTFPEWWGIWQKSGHYKDLQGIGTYCMARIADDGPYAANNVYICTFAQNSHDQYFSGKQRKKPIAIHVEPRAFGESFFPDAVYGVAA